MGSPASSTGWKMRLTPSRVGSRYATSRRFEVEDLARTATSGKCRSRDFRFPGWAASAISLTHQESTLWYKELGVTIFDLLFILLFLAGCFGLVVAAWY